MGVPGATDAVRYACVFCLPASGRRTVLAASMEETERLSARRQLFFLRVGGLGVFHPDRDFHGRRLLVRAVYRALNRRDASKSGADALDHDQSRIPRLL